VFAAAEVTCHAQGLRVRVDDDHGVNAIFVAAAAVIFDRLAGAVLAGRHRTVRYYLRPPSLDVIKLGRASARQACYVTLK
jgi:hypothetical protein